MGMDGYQSWCCNVCDGEPFFRSLRDFNDHLAWHRAGMPEGPPKQGEAKWCCAQHMPAQYFQSLESYNLHMAWVHPSAAQATATVDFEKLAESIDRAFKADKGEEQARSSPKPPVKPATCRICGEQPGRIDNPRATGPSAISDLNPWATFVFPLGSKYDEARSYLCPPCGTKVAEFIAHLQQPILDEEDLL